MTEYIELVGGGISMIPTLSRGAELILFDKRSIKVGDIIRFKADWGSGRSFTGSLRLKMTKSSLKATIYPIVIKDTGQPKTLKES